MGPDLETLDMQLPPSVKANGRGVGALSPRFKSRCSFGRTSDLLPSIMIGPQEGYPKHYYAPYTVQEPPDIPTSPGVQGIPVGTTPQAYPPPPTYAPPADQPPYYTYQPPPVRVRPPTAPERESFLMGCLAALAAVACCCCIF